MWKQNFNDTSHIHIFFKFYVSWSSPDFDPIFASLWAVGTNMQSLIN